LQSTDLLVVFLGMNHQCMVMNQLKLTIWAIAQTSNIWSFQITVHTFLLLLVISDVHGWPGRSSSFTVSLPSKNHLRHSKTRGRDMQSLPKVKYHLFIFPLRCWLLSYRVSLIIFVSDLVVIIGTYSQISKYYIPIG
jgi:hypothetical protein